MTNYSVKFVIFGLLLSPWISMSQATTFTRPADAVKYRQGLFQVMSMHTQQLGSMAKSDLPFDKIAAENHAAIIDLLSKQLSTSFPAGSDVTPSKSKPEVWQESAAFKSKLSDLVISSGKLNMAVKGGDVNAFKAAFSATSQACKACHDAYRNR